MDEKSVNNAMVRDSFELYESPKKIDMTGTATEGTLNGAGAPGSPGSMLEYRQAMSNMQREIEERKKREMDLINLLRTTQTNTGPLVVDPQYVNLEVSSSCDNVGESVKDAHIKYLQRQVTVLQASLFKYEGWSHKMVAITKERDDAFNELTALQSENKILAEKNKILQMEMNNMEANFQRKLQQTEAEMEALLQQGARGTDLMLSVRGNEKLLEELERLKAENRTLKESLSRLEAENKHLKELSMSVSNSSHSLGNVACSQELEYLHKVVDTLKKTVLEQRRFLLSMRSPNMSSSAKEIPSLQPSFSTASQAGFEASASKDSPVALMKRPSDTSGALTQQPPALNRIIFSREETGDNMIESKSQDFRQSANSNAINGVAEGSKNELLDNLKLQNSLNVMPRNHVSAVESQMAIQKPLNLDQNGSGESSRPAAISGYIQMYSPRHRVSQSEVLGRRVAEEQSNQFSKSVTIAHNSEYVNTNTVNRPVKPDPLHYLSKEEVTNNIGYNLKSGHSPSQPANYEPLRHSAWDTAQLLGDDIAINSNSQNSRQQQGVLQPIQLRADAVVANNRANISNSSVKSPAQPPPPPHRPKSHISSLGGNHIYANEQSPSDTVILREPRPVQQQQSDRLCPVCSKDFSMLSMEEFQTHVFRCFDDDEAPETMKPEETSRQCPMCGMNFNNSTPQAEYEKHVHSHFGEDNPGENFEILHP
ncbi:uncharacterized protein LOC106054818 isoform X1 [Biomphalaria glabrata]|uniref:Uncharacterized protein LOC106054818 isoform X1 n=2 Tax=Biomphalaria glabrata TaxID=6526 RepID=A0A9U8DY96_BIOGL|nr:uncharacterized protein LOC106054818 isoform X1 [Biomphalaria glabrata]XP_013066320.2 uncharacterized protein LOC106054818 isoform X1 [Biomphalaria glabrata]XP_013066321.2 uncharacterized protein LOC106054818 isoform X1 [Biomphalaria glabrata]XP_013066323.2 uncharacterized protein LOC106054818 isoform X1 [Biomphalaria glabrata]XP_013066325.2 uncharacterized protein LOC106054818 isoform X1 [Biomphalaria glabrata]XP_055859727.1 uncharacterized protein LOC106054818 isoform X1 [Biomphalaria gla